MGSRKRRDGIHSSPTDVAVMYITQKTDREGFRVMEIPPKGRGIVAKTCFSKGEFLLQYAGQLLSGQEGDELEETCSSGYRFFIKFKGKDYCIDATEEPIKGPKLGRLVNHGERKEVNVKLVTLDVCGQPVLCLFALRNIDEGEELLYNYGISNLPWKKKPKETALPRLSEALYHLDDDYNPFEDESLLVKIRRCNDPTDCSSNNKNSQEESFQKDSRASNGNTGDHHSSEGCAEGDTDEQQNSRENDHSPDYRDTDDQSYDNISDIDTLGRVKEGSNCSKQTMINYNDLNCEYPIDWRINSSNISKNSGLEKDPLNSQNGTVDNEGKAIGTTEDKNESSDDSPEEEYYHQNLEAYEESGTRRGDTEVHSSSRIIAKENTEDWTDGDRCESGGEQYIDDKSVTLSDANINSDESSEADSDGVQNDSSSEYCPDDSDTDDEINSDFNDDDIPSEGIMEKADYHSGAHRRKDEGSHSGQQIIFAKADSSQVCGSDNELSHVSDSSEGEICEQIIPLPDTSMRQMAEKKRRDTLSESKVSSSEDRKRSGVKVLISSNTKTVRKWDKHQICVFCNESKAKLARHFQAIHSNETEVQEALSYDKRSPRRKALFQILTNKGNHAHNLDVLQAGEGFIIPYKRPENDIPAGDFLPCEWCLGWFVALDMWKHTRKCPLKQPVNGRNKGLMARCSLLAHPTNEVDAAFRENVLGIMRLDAVSLICKNDKLILSFGGRLSSNKEAHTPQYISTKMRELGRLLKAVRVANPNVESLAECIQPTHFDKVVAAARTCAKYDPATQQYQTPSLALKLGHSLKTCARIQKIAGIKLGDEEMKENADRFEELCTLEWSNDVSSRALSTLYKRKWNKPTILPLSEDVVNLHKHISSVMAESKERLSKTPDKLAWHSLAQSCLSKVILFNRRRSGEVQRMSQDDYKKCGRHSNDEILTNLTEWEQKLCKEFSRVEIRGKRGRKVPILLTSEMKCAMDLLTTTRLQVGVSDLNPYVFARPNLDSKFPLRGSDCLGKMALESGAKCPEAITSTKLRKQIATVSQLFCLKRHELDILANFLGHDINVHREYYRLPDDTLQITKVARLLLAMEKGQTASFRDKNLSEIEVPLDDPCTSEGESDSDEESTEPADEEVTKKSSKRSGLSPSQRKLKHVKTGTRQNAEENVNDDEDEIENIVFPQEDLQGRSKAKANAQKKTVPSKCRQPRKGQRRIFWTAEETIKVSDYFQKHIRLGRVPKKHECTNCKQKLTPLLDGKDWKNIKYKIYNTIISKRRR